MRGQPVRPIGLVVRDLLDRHGPPGELQRLGEWDGLPYVANGFEPVETGVRDKDRRGSRGRGVDRGEYPGGPGRQDVFERAGGGQ